MTMEFLATMLRHPGNFWFSILVGLLLAASVLVALYNYNARDATTGDL